MAGDPPIIIESGSVSIEYPESLFPPDPDKRGRFKNNNKKIRRIEISGGGLSYDETVNGTGVVIKIHYS